MSGAPWTPERRDAVKRKIDKEAARAAARLGAGAVTIIASFPDGEYLHVLDGGSNLMSSTEELYKRMLSARAILKESGDEDVSIS